MTDDKRLIEDYLPIVTISAQALQGKSARFFDIPVAAIEQAAAKHTSLPSPTL
jgi:hypothetical protein